jgi:hypothetical protein
MLFSLTNQKDVRNLFLSVLSICHTPHRWLVASAHFLPIYLVRPVLTICARHVTLPSHIVYKVLYLFSNLSWH